MSIFVAQGRGLITTQNLVANGDATANSAVAIDVFGAASMVIQVTGTYTGALSVQLTVDGKRWETVTGSLVFNAQTAVAAATIASATIGIFIVPVHGALFARVTGLAAMTGSAVVTMRSLEEPVTLFGLTLASGVLTSVTAVTTLSNGQAAHDAVIVGSPHRIAGRALTANYTAVASGDTADLVTTLVGAVVNQPFSIPDLSWQFTSGGLTTTTAVAAKAAAAAGIRNYVTSVIYQNTHATVASAFYIQDGGTTIYQTVCPANMPMPVVVTFPMPLRGTAATALNVNCGTAGANIVTNVQGFQAP